MSSGGGSSHSDGGSSSDGAEDEAGAGGGKVAAGPAAAPARVSHGAELGAAHILDCYLGPSTYACAAAAAGAAADVAVAVARGEAPCGAAIIRPPGHHAEGGLALGFCYFNHAAVAARAAQAAGGAARVLVLDWDVSGLCGRVLALALGGGGLGV
jgi:hypothetical protein